MKSIMLKDEIWKKLSVRKLKEGSKNFNNLIEKLLNDTTHKGGNENGRKSK